MSKKSKMMDILLCLFLGIFGAHRFYEGKIITGILYLVTFGFAGLGVLIDLLQIITGCRTDTNKLPIGKPCENHSRIIHIGSIVLAVTVWLLISYAVWQHLLHAPMVKEGYYNNIPTTGVLEQKYTKPGDHAVRFTESESQQALFDTYKIWYPSELEQAGDHKYPIVVMANGTGVPYIKYSAVFEHLASWGFVVIGNSDDSSGSGISSSLTLDYITALSKDAYSIFYKKLDLHHIGISGHSQGGAGAINAVTRFPNSERFTTIYTASATSSTLIDALKLTDWRYDTGRIHIPYFMVAATGQFDSETIAPITSLTANFEKMNHEMPAVMARRKNVDHGDMLAYADGYMTAWFRYTLMNDRQAAGVFRGDSAELRSNSANWQDVRMKHMDRSL